MDEPVAVHVVMAPSIPADSWLQEERFAEFCQAYQYAMRQTLAIPGLSKLHPTEAYHLYDALRRGHEWVAQNAGSGG